MVLRTLGYMLFTCTSLNICKMCFLGPMGVSLLSYGFISRTKPLSTRLTTISLVYITRIMELLRFNTAKVSPVDVDKALHSSDGMGAGALCPSLNSIFLSRGKVYLRVLNTQCAFVQRISLLNLSWSSSNPSTNEERYLRGGNLDLT